jgi:cell division protein FtsQ
VAVKSSGQARARTAAAEPLRALRIGDVVRRFAPTRRSLAVGLGCLAFAGGAYAAARETSAFAVQRIEVTGAPADVQNQVRHSLASFDGTSLLGLDGGALERNVESLPSVVSATYDRAFPHTLRIAVVPERPVAVLRRGRQWWLVSARARVIARLAPHSEAALPRIWLPTTVAVAAGQFLGPADGGTAVRALALAGGFPVRLATAAMQHGILLFRLGSGLELRLGEASDIRLKLAIARRALPLLPSDAAYLDISVPGRPVAGPANTQVSTRG